MQLCCCGPTLLSNANFHLFLRRYQDEIVQEWSCFAEHASDALIRHSCSPDSKRWYSDWLVYKQISNKYYKAWNVQFPDPFLLSSSCCNGFYIPHLHASKLNLICTKRGIHPLLFTAFLFSHFQKICHHEIFTNLFYIFSLMSKYI